MTLTLASTSPYRKSLLENAGFTVETSKPNVDEELIKNQLDQPKEIAETLAKLKAESGKQLSKGDWVIGSDQVACLGQKIFDKPRNYENAVNTLSDLQGRTHQLITSVHLITPNGASSWSNITTLTMRHLEVSEIEAYVGQDQPYDCAGSYKLERGGIRLFSNIESTDFTAIQGLPMIELCNRLIHFGYKFN